MATFTPTQIAMVAWNAGIHDEPTIARAVAIALAESSGITTKHNTDSSTGDNSYGLWQINMIGTMGPARRKQFDIVNNDALFDPQTNAHAMYKISNGGKNWSAWSAFKNNSYLTHINPALNAAKEVVAKANAASSGNPLQYLFNGVGAAKGAANALSDKIASGLDIGSAISASFNSLGASLMKMGLNVFAVIFAAILIILAIVIMLRAPLGKAAKVVVGVGENVAPGGKIATRVARLGAQRTANTAARVAANTKLAKANAAAAKVAK